MNKDNDNGIQLLQLRHRLNISSQKRLAPKPFFICVDLCSSVVRRFFAFIRGSIYFGEVKFGHPLGP